MALAMWGPSRRLNFNEREGSGEIGENDSFFTAEQIPLGNLAGQRDTVDVFGSAGFEVGSSGGFVTDVDYFQFDLQAGDILDVSGIGGIDTVNLFLPGNQFWIGQDGFIDAEDDAPSAFPLDSPLQTLGNVNIAQIAPFTGTYTLVVSAESILSNYTLGLRTYRPVTESLPIGSSQTIFLDFDGGLFPRDEFNFDLTDGGGVFAGGLFRVPPIAQTLNDVGLVAQPQEFNTVAQRTVRGRQRALR